MPIELPTQRREAQQYNPRLLVLFGKPKSGKIYDLPCYRVICNIITSEYPRNLNIKSAWQLEEA